MTATAGNAEATVSWSAPASDGGAAITGYTVTASPGGGSCVWVAGPLSCVVAGLSNGTAYTFSVTATNSVGTGPPSAPSNEVTPFAPVVDTAPGAPTGVSASPGNGQAAITWIAPLDNGGQPVTGYTVTASPGGGSCVWVAGPLSCVVAGLSNGTPYTFTVTATNSVGTSSPSLPSNEVTPSDATPYTVTATPTSDLTDGTRITINLKTTASQPIFGAFARVCRSGVTYQGSTSSTPNPDFNPAGPNCPPRGLSSSADTVAASSSTFEFAPTPEGDTMFLRVGVGVVDWEYNGAPQSLTCDQANPCSLVVQIRTGPVGEPLVWVPLVFDLDFLDADPIAGCGGPAPGILATASTDALSEAWIRWTLDSCNTQGLNGAWTAALFGDEVNAVDRFARGELDVAYTGVGYNDEAGFLSDETLAQGPRRSVAVPVGIGASVLALGNGYRSGDRKIPYGPTTLTTDELTTILAGGEWGLSPEDEVAITTRNPELGVGPGIFAESATSSVRVGGPSEGGTTPWLTTRHLKQLSPDRWKVPDLPLFFPNTGRERGVHNNLALADPTFNAALSLATGRPGLAKIFGGLAPQGGGIWVLTDLTTALSLDLQPVSIEGSDGNFVLPDNTSMRQAVSTMERTDDGMLLAEPGLTEGYPLTYVVYAVVPAEPLADPTTGLCRTQSQALLTNWLDYVTDEGQSLMPAGMAPLTPELRAEARAKLAEVGATAAATPCLEQPPTTPTTTPTTTPPPTDTPAGTTTGAPVGSSSLVGSGARPLGGAATGALLAAEALSDTAAGDEEAALEAIDVPPSEGGSSTSGLAAAIGLLGLIALPTAAARFTSGTRKGTGVVEP